MKGKKQKKAFNPNGFLLLITIVLFFVMYAIGMVVFRDKGFLRWQTFFNLFINNAGLIVISAGMTVVMITGGIDISVGGFTALICMFLAWSMENKGFPVYLSIAVALVMGVVFGIVQGFLVAYVKIQPFIVTLAGMFFARGMTAIINLEMISIKNETFLSWAQAKISMPFGAYINRRGDSIYPYIYPTVVIALVIVALVFVLLRYTKFGRSVYAVGGNEQSALLMGLNVRRTKFLAYTLDGFLCSIGGILYCLNTCSGSVGQATGLEMDAIAATVIGGTLLSGGVGNVIGSLFGVLIRGTISSFITFIGTLASGWGNIAVSVLLAFFIILQSLFARAKEKS